MKCIARYLVPCLLVVDRKPAPHQPSTDLVLGACEAYLPKRCCCHCWSVVSGMGFS
jgi:hypothetical protein